MYRSSLFTFVVFAILFLLTPMLFAQVNWVQKGQDIDVNWDDGVSCIYESDGDFIKSLEYFERAYEIAKKYNYMSLIGLYLLNIGFTHIYLCNYIKGLRILKKSHKILSDLDDKFCMTFTLFGIGMAYYKSGKREGEKKPCWLKPSGFQHGRGAGSGELIFPRERSLPSVAAPPPPAAAIRGRFCL